jgi:archaellum component FlaC
VVFTVSVEEQRDPLLLDLAQRVSRLEARVEALEKTVESVKQRVERVDEKTWWILSGVVLSILIQVLFYLLR